MNKLYKMTKEEFEQKKILYQFDDVKYIVMDGAGIETYEQHFDKLWEVFSFGKIPEDWEKDYHTEYDFLPEEKYTVIIKNYDKFMNNNKWEKENLEDTYENYLLPFWDEEVERIVKEGKRKDFRYQTAENCELTLLKQRSAESIVLLQTCGRVIPSDCGAITKALKLSKNNRYGTFTFYNNKSNLNIG